MRAIANKTFTVGPWKQVVFYQGDIARIIAADLYTVWFETKTGGLFGSCKWSDWTLLKD